MERGGDDVEYATLEWVDWFNNRQLLEPISNTPSSELEESAMVAWLTLNSLRYPLGGGANIHTRNLETSLLC